MEYQHFDSKKEKAFFSEDFMPRILQHFVFLCVVRVQTYSIKQQNGITCLWYLFKVKF